MKKWENTYLVFDVTKGPKVIIETLNTYGEDGWESSSMLTVAGSNIVAFLKREIPTKDSPKVDKEQEKVSKLWAGE